MKKIYAFDFDGTLTRRDTLIAFLVYTSGWKELLKCFALHLHLLVGMKLGIFDSGKVKQLIFAWYFDGMPAELFDDLCRRFAANHRHLLRPKGMKKLRELAEQPDTQVMVVSASIINWVEPFFAGLPQVELSCTQVEVSGETLTGKFLSANCRRKEKVRRILALHPDRDDYWLTAYGDSSGDIEMLNFADEAYYKPFR